jgi:hypothetical protein
MAKDLQTRADNAAARLLGEDTCGHCKQFTLSKQRRYRDSPSGTCTPGRVYGQYDGYISGHTVHPDWSACERFVWRGPDGGEVAW